MDAPDDPTRAVPVCIYCQRRSATTLDHIPPRALFARQYHASLLKLPSCLDCNQGASRDDEIFRTTMCYWLGEVSDPRLDEVSRATERALFWRPGKGGLLGWLRDQVVPGVTLQTPSGIVIPGMGALRLPAKRLRRVLERITKGLIFHHQGAPLSLDREITIAFASAYGPSRERADRALRILAPFLTTQPMRELAGGCFRYRFVVADDDPKSSAWELVLYDRLTFGAIVDPPG